MPTALFIGPYCLFFWSYDCAELRHSHGQRDEKRAKFWLEPIRVADNHGFCATSSREIERLMVEHLYGVQDERWRWDPALQGGAGARIAFVVAPVHPTVPPLAARWESIRRGAPYHSDKGVNKGSGMNIAMALFQRWLERRKKIQPNIKLPTSV